MVVVVVGVADQREEPALAETVRKIGWCVLLKPSIHLGASLVSSLLVAILALWGSGVASARLDRRISHKCTSTISTSLNSTSCLSKKSKAAPKFAEDLWSHPVKSNARCTSVWDLHPSCIARHVCRRFWVVLGWSGDQFVRVRVAVENSFELTLNMEFIVVRSI